MTRATDIQVSRQMRGLQKKMYNNAMSRTCVCIFRKKHNIYLKKNQNKIKAHILNILIFKLFIVAILNLPF